MIVFCEPKDLKDIEYDHLFNLSSVYEGAIQLKYLMPNQFTVSQYEDEKEFDKVYAGYVIGEDAAFIEFFKLVYLQYEKADSLTVVLVKRDWVRDMVMESIITLIQELYGINCFIVNEPDDWENVVYDEVTCNFDAMGITNFDRDKERYVTLTVDIEEVVRDNQRHGDNSIPPQMLKEAVDGLKEELFKTNG